MTWKDIPGWFDFNEIYQEAVEKASHGATFVEIGAYLGKSTAFMAQLIKDSGKRINFVTIDPFIGEKGQNNDYLFERYVENMHSCGVNDYVVTHKGYSQDAHVLFKEKTIDFLFIDGDHSYEACKSDIKLYLPKMKEGSVMAGHDYYNAPGVKQAVDEAFGNRVQISGSSWVVQL